MAQMKKRKNKGARRKNQDEVGHCLLVCFFLFEERSVPRAIVCEEWNAERKNVSRTRREVRIVRDLAV